MILSFSKICLLIPLVSNLSNADGKEFGLLRKREEAAQPMKVDNLPEEDEAYWNRLLQDMNLSVLPPAPVPPQGLRATYTSDEDFDLGESLNINHNDPDNDQLQLNSDFTPFNFMWVACSDRGTVVKVDTVAGKVVGEYRSTPSSFGNGNPSRTTVDTDGSVWLANRADVWDGYGSVVHIGLEENNQCQDRNGNGVIDTSRGLNDTRAWASEDVNNSTDECIVHYTKVNSTGTRHVSIDANNNVWVGGKDLQNFDLVKGGRWSEENSGNIIRSETSVGFGGYGGLEDANGVIWSSNTNGLLRWDTKQTLSGPNGDPEGLDAGPPTPGTNWTGQVGDSYGLCIDKSSGNVWVTQLNGNLIRQYDKDGIHLGQYAHGFDWAQGCVVDENSHVWVAHSLSGTTVGHLSSNGTLLGIVDLEGGIGPTGVAVDGKGKVWTTNYNSNSLSRIDPALNGGIGKVDLNVSLGVGAGPYNYGDMTGSTNTARPNYGSWTVIHNNTDDTPTKIEWTADVPPGSRLTVQVRNSSAQQWQPVTSGQDISNLTGESLHVQVLFERAADGKSPVLYDLSILYKDEEKN